MRTVVASRSISSTTVSVSSVEPACACENLGWLALVIILKLESVPGLASLKPGTLLIQTCLTSHSAGRDF